MAELREVLWELHRADQDPGAAASALYDRLDGPLLCPLEVYLVLSRPLVEIDIALFQSPPVLLCDHLVVVWLLDNRASKVLEAGHVKLEFLLIAHACQVEELSVDHIPQVGVLQVLGGLRGVDHWVHAQDCQRLAVVLRDGRHQVDGVDAGSAE